MTVYAQEIGKLFESFARNMGKMGACGHLETSIFQSGILLQQFWEDGTVAGGGALGAWVQIRDSKTETQTCVCNIDQCRVSSQRILLYPIVALRVLQRQ